MSSSGEAVLFGDVRMRSLVMASMAIALAFALAASVSSRAFAESGMDPGDGQPGVSGVPNASGVIPDYTPARSIHTADEGEPGAAMAPQATGDLPVSYSSVDAGFVSPVRNQGAFGTCWAFSAIGALESSLLAHGQVQVPDGEAAANAIDLSERHLLYFTYHSVLDPLGYTEGDSALPKASQYVPDQASDTYLGAGGNPGMAAYLLASWRGAVDETVAPYAALTDAYDRYQVAQWSESDDYSYEQLLADTALDSSQAYGSDSWHVSGIRQISLSDSSDVKRAIMEYGGAAFLMYYDDDYMNHETNSYYYYGNYDTNHAVLVVGWDDDYDADKFPYVDTWAEEHGFQSTTKTKKPSGGGAWLLKNSYDSWWGDGGYFWMSYKDISLRGAYSKGFVFEASAPDNYDNIYQHDGSTGAFWNYVKSGGSIANVFTACAAEGDAAGEMLEAVSFALDDVNVDYSVQVYVNPRDPADPSSGSPALSQPVTGKTSYAGYYTVPLPYGVPLRLGDDYSVVVTLSHGSGARVAYSVDASSSRWDWVTFVSGVHAGDSFEQDTAGASWDDLSSLSCDSGDERRCAARVKAFTRTVAADALCAIPFDDAFMEVGVLDALANGGFAYTGGEVRPSVTASFGGSPLAEGVDYELSFANNVEIGTAIVTVKGIGLYSGAVTAQFEIVEPPVTPSAGGGEGAAKAPNPMKLSVKKRSVKVSKLKRKARKVSCISFKGKAAGTLRFSKLSKGSSKRLSVNKNTGKIIVKKRTKRGLYKIRVKVRASGNASFLPATKVVTCKVRVKS